jgi:formyl-CoA transferase
MPELDKIAAIPFATGESGPLRGVRILDLSRLVAGNMMTCALADFGAEVTKVEPLGGDPLRAWGSGSVSTHWKVYARNKRSLCIDFRKEGAIELLLRLAASFDVLVENFRPGALESMGLGPQILLGVNPRLVIVRISGWGQDGPFAHKPGFGTLVEGMSGFASMNGFADREPVLPPIQLADSVAGIQGAFATLAALREVESGSGKGQVVDLSLFEPFLSILGPQALNYQVSGKVKKRTGSRSTTAGPRNVFRTRDEQWICLSASMQAMAERLLRAIGRPELTSDPRYATNAARIEHAAELERIIGAFVATRTLDENLHFFEAADVTVGPVYDVSQIVEDDYVAARAALVRVPDSDLGTACMHNVAPRFSFTPGSIRSEAPRLGEHNEMILATAGFDASAIDDLWRRGVLGGAGRPNPGEGNG